MTKTILSALDVAKLTAQLEGAPYKRSASKDAAIARFIKAAAGKLSAQAASLIIGTAKSFADAVQLLESARHETKAKVSPADEALSASLSRTLTRKAKRTPQVAALPGMTPLGIKAPAAKPDADMPDFLVRRGTKEEAEAGEKAWAQAAERRRARQDAEEKAKPKAASKNAPVATPAAAAAIAAIAGEGRVRKSTAEVAAAAAEGKVPAAPDFSADTHKRFRPKLAELVALVEAGDVKGLRAYPIKPISTSPKAMDRYRNLCIIALEARAVKGSTSKKAA